MIDAKSLARADRAWEIRRLRAARPENRTLEFMTWETQPAGKRAARIAKWAEILTILGQAGLTPQALAQEDVAWQVRRIASHSPGLAPLASWEVHSPAWRGEEIAKWEKILAGLRANPRPSWLFDES
jgi:hypothetical protein